MFKNCLSFTKTVVYMNSKKVFFATKLRYALYFTLYFIPIAHKDYENEKRGLFGFLQNIIHITLSVTSSV
jgi:hypothetical protein